VVARVGVSLSHWTGLPDDNIFSMFTGHMAVSNLLLTVPFRFFNIFLS
jgi:hypothetical protein